MLNIVGNITTKGINVKILKYCLGDYFGDTERGEVLKIWMFDFMMFLSKIIDKNAGILQIGYLLKGSFDVTIGDEQAVLKEGDSYYAQPGVVHSVVALEDSALLDVFTPQREDFMKTS